jgi:hypothetical protein
LIHRPIAGPGSGKSATAGADASPKDGA